MHPHRLEQLVASVPAGITDDQRSRLDAHVETADGCRARIERVRGDLRRALDGQGGDALDLACELDGLERVQQRVDGWLTALVDELSRARHSAHYGDGVPV
ncbi:hypothetical protein [Pseudonocardia broussonetiae]|uniref:Transcription regulator PadR C-terminal domain-containing protein n=1 Tax=Pseudonocardia broussonetiae TaxID=2736640 RepID=A0A6M6JP61_9PSEU|nr:hypothetical protein [Pseudonocardia broussonetiae]QJY49814.1 hypothetical protein HOP40_31950 [Pseudonocardia broussonetiae]